MQNRNQDEISSSYVFHVSSSSSSSFTSMQFSALSLRPTLDFWSPWQPVSRNFKPDTSSNLLSLWLKIHVKAMELSYTV